jgi:hypothetical protein
MLPTFAASHSGLAPIYRGSKEEEAKRGMVNASLSPLCRKSSARGKRKNVRLFVVPGNPTFKLRGIGVGESEAAQRDVVELVLAVKLGAIPSK